MFAWQDCSKLFTSCSKLVLLQNCSKLVDNKLVLTIIYSWLAELYLLLLVRCLNNLEKAYWNKPHHACLEQVVEKLKSSELLCKQIRSSKLCSVSGLTNLQHFVIEVTRCINRIERVSYDDLLLILIRPLWTELICSKWTKSHTIGCCYVLRGRLHEPSCPGLPSWLG